MQEIEIYFYDLNEEKQAELLEAAGLSSPKDANWDVMPIAVVPLEES